MPKKINLKKKKGKPTPVNFQDTILNLQKFWGNYEIGRASCRERV